ncbi:uncharacterized protein LOC119069595 [Bradysia coprophila]|uniref:uncharacterized protein LOC119069595 n=1 Tax=Bradysia coprophila TaxID=38358 RepID=UPI00187D7002|nr:uncharacterized protein LOC119069595 [Bradysia coprophila]
MSTINGNGVSPVAIINSQNVRMNKEKDWNDSSGPTIKYTSFPSFFHYPTDWTNTLSPEEQRKGFVEPHGYISRVNVRDGVIGDAWMKLDSSSLNSRLDLKVLSSVRSSVSPIKGNVYWCAEDKLGSLTAEDDRLCSLKNYIPDRHRDKPILQLSPIGRHSEEVGCYANVCIDNSFITHVPYMGVKEVEIIYDVLVGREGSGEWVERDLKKWCKNESLLEKHLTFGRFIVLPVKIFVPAELSLMWNDTFAARLTSWFSDNLSSIEDADDLVGIVYITEGKICINIKSSGLKPFHLSEIELGQISTETTKSWPAHILKHRILLVGAPSVDSLKPSPIAEVRMLQTELAKYTSTLRQIDQIKAMGIWCFERVIQMYTAQRDGFTSESSPFVVHKVDYSKVFRPKPNDIQEDMCKGSGLPIVNGNPQYDAICDGLLLKGISRSPMNIANSLQYNRFVFGKDLGTPLSVVDSLFLFDYGGDWTMPTVRTWLYGLGCKIAEIHAVGSNGEKSLIEATVLSYETIRAKKRYEDSMRRSNVKLEYVCVWKDFKELLHYRILDAVFVKSTILSSLDEEGYYVVGFATVVHDLGDYGYDISICECSGMLYTLGAVDGTYESIEHAYAVTLAGIRYVSKVHRYTVSGLTLASTHYWQICNGRHRFLNCAMSVAEHRHPKQLPVNGTLLDTICNRKREEYLIPSPEHDHDTCVRIYTSLSVRCSARGHAFPTLLRALVARPYERIYKKTLDKIDDLAEVDCMSSIFDCVCVDAADDAIDLLWDIACFMWDETAIMWHTLLGSLLVVSQRMIADDSAGFGYSDRPWQREN